MSNNLKIWLPIAFALALVFGIEIGILLQSSSGKRSMFATTQTNDLQEVINYINAKYVDTVNTAKLTEGTIQDMLSKLDPHSVFIPADNLAGVNEELQGNFEGIGIEFFRISDTVDVVNVIPGGPSDKAGLKKGDRIVTINDSSAVGNGFTNDILIRKLKGIKGTTVKVGIKRNGVPGLKSYTITRGTIPLNSVNTYYMVNSEVGYIKLDRFSSTTFDEFMRAMNSLEKQGMKKLIFDLRDNGGGILDQATSILDEFIDKDKLLVYTQGRVFPRVDYKAHVSGTFETGPLCVLIDEGSASASEIVAGALQDWDRATILGRRSFGKGLVQEQYQLADGAALRLTIAKYYTPSGRCIQRSYSNGSDSYYHDVFKRFTDGELTNADSITFKDTTKYYTSKGRVVYGGGGIMPDVFVPYDTSYQSKLLHRVEAEGWLQEFAYSYSFNNNNVDVNAINKSELAIDFSRFLIGKNMKWSDADWSKSSGYMMNQLVAYIAREESGDNAYYKITNSTDVTFKKALDYLEKKEAGSKK